MLLPFQSSNRPEHPSQPVLILMDQSGGTQVPRHLREIGRHVSGADTAGQSTDWILHFADAIQKPGTNAGKHTTSLHARPQAVARITKVSLADACQGRHAHTHTHTHTCPQDVCSKKPSHPERPPRAQNWKQLTFLDALCLEFLPGPSSTATRFHDKLTEKQREYHKLPRVVHRDRIFRVEASTWHFGTRATPATIRMR